MAIQLLFTVSRHFKTTEVGITIPCVLERNGRLVEVDAKVDPGSEFCLFNREAADELGIEVEDGYAIRLNTLTGNLTAYAHSVTLRTLGINFESLVLFHPAYDTRRNLLGRVGWLNNLHLALTMDDETIYLKSIDSNENL